MLLEPEPDVVAWYGESHGLRLLRELAREYPATRALLGPERFEAVAAAVVARSGSRSFTLEGCAGGLPAFLRRMRSGADPRMRSAAAALAAFERERARVLRAKVAPPCERPGCLQPGDGARLLAYAWAVDDAWTRFQQGIPLRELWAAPTRLALFRRAGSSAVVALPVCDREAPLLRALLRGQRVERAMEAAAVCLAPDAIRSALQRWVASGLLREPAHLLG
jgi:hypothetical protein